MSEVIIFDTEYTAWEGSRERRWRGPGEVREIVQIGAVTLRAESLEEMGQFEVLMRPERNPVLSSYFIALTGISQAAMHQNGRSFSDGVARFRQFVGPRTTYCYGVDDQFIVDQGLRQNTGHPWPSLFAHNIGRWFHATGVNVTGINSGALAQHVGGMFDAPAHNALNDARSIAEAIRTLVRRGAANPFTHHDWRAG